MTFSLERENGTRVEVLFNPTDPESHVAAPLYEDLAYNSGPWKCIPDTTVSKLIPVRKPDGENGEDFRRRNASYNKEVHAYAALDRLPHDHDANRHVVKAENFALPTDGYRFLLIPRVGEDVLTTKRTATKYQNAGKGSLGGSDPDLNASFALATLGAYLRLFSYIHSPDVGFIHGDIKIENTLCASANEEELVSEQYRTLPRIVIIDFAHSSQIEGTTGSIPKTDDSPDARPFEATPYVRLRKMAVSTRTISDDYFALAVTTYAIYYDGRLPFTYKPEGQPRRVDAVIGSSFNSFIAKNGSIGEACDSGNCHPVDAETFHDAPEPLRQLWSKALQFEFIINPSLLDEEFQARADELKKFADRHMARRKYLEQPELVRTEVSQPRQTVNHTRPDPLADWIPKLQYELGRLRPPSADLSPTRSPSGREDDADGPGLDLTATTAKDAVSDAGVPDSVPRRESTSVEEGRKASKDTTTGEDNLLAVAWLLVAFVSSLLPVLAFAAIVHLGGLSPLTASEATQFSKVEPIWCVAVAAACIAVVAGVIFFGTHTGSAYRSRLEQMHPATRVTGALALLILPWTLMLAFLLMRVMPDGALPAITQSWTPTRWATVAAFTLGGVLISTSILLWSTGVGGEHFRKWGVAAMVLGLLCFAAPFGVGSLSVKDNLQGELERSESALLGQSPLACTDPYPLSIESKRWCLSASDGWSADPVLDLDLDPVARNLLSIPLILTDLSRVCSDGTSPVVKIYGGTLTNVAAATRAEYGAAAIVDSHRQLDSWQAKAGYGPNRLVSNEGLQLVEVASVNAGASTLYWSYGIDERESTAIALVDTPGCAPSENRLDALVNGLDVRSDPCFDFEYWSHSVGISSARMQSIEDANLCLRNDSGWTYSQAEVSPDPGWSDVGHMAVTRDGLMWSVRVIPPIASRYGAGSLVPGFRDVLDHEDPVGREFSRVLYPSTTDPLEIMAEPVVEQGADFDSSALSDTAVRNIAELLTSVTTTSDGK